MFIFRKNRQQIILCSAKNTQRDRETNTHSEKDSERKICFCNYNDRLSRCSNFKQQFRTLLLEIGFEKFAPKKEGCAFKFGSSARFNQLFEVVAIVRYGVWILKRFVYYSQTNYVKLTRIFAWKLFHLKTSG